LRDTIQNYPHYLHEHRTDSNNLQNNADANAASDDFGSELVRQLAAAISIRRKNLYMKNRCSEL